jgi:hypothetical protein
MNVTTLEAPVAPTRRAPQPTVRTSAPSTAPTRRPRRVGRGAGPESRPPRPLGVPRGVGPSSTRPQSCTVSAPSRAEPAPGSRWRLTERGIALVLVTGLLIVAASLAVIGLTALRVTGDLYQPAGQTVLTRP